MLSASLTAARSGRNHPVIFNVVVAMISSHVVRRAGPAPPLFLLPTPATRSRASRHPMAPIPRRTGLARPRRCSGGRGAPPAAPAAGGRRATASRHEHETNRSPFRSSTPQPAAIRARLLAPPRLVRLRRWWISSASVRTPARPPGSGCSGLIHDPGSLCTLSGSSCGSTGCWMRSSRRPKAISALIHQARSLLTHQAAGAGRLAVRQPVLRSAPGLARRGAGARRGPEAPLGQGRDGCHRRRTPAPVPYAASRFCGLPRMNAWRFSTVVARMRCRASRLNHAMCGVTITSSRSSSRLPATS